MDSIYSYSKSSRKWWSDFDFLDKTSLNNSWKCVLKIRQGLKSRFEKELGFLKYSKKNMKKVNDEVRVGDVVLVYAEGKRWVTWPFVRVIEVILRKDEETKLIELKL